MGLAGMTEATSETLELNLEDFLPYRLNVAAALSSQALSETYAPRYGISVPEWRVRVTPGQEGRRTRQGLGEQRNTHKTKRSRGGALPPGRQIEARKANRQDLREALLSLTPTGRRVYQDLVPAALNFSRALLDALDPTERTAFDRALHKLTERSRALAGNGRAKNE